MDDNHLDFSDLPSLPPDQIRVMGHIIRNQGIRHSELQAAMRALPDGEHIDAQELAAILEQLVNKQLLNVDEQGEEPTYQVRMRRKTSQIRTIQGIWNALDSGDDGESLESRMNPEMRKARSKLANSLLADLSKEDQYDYNSPPDNPEEAQQTGQALLGDLVSAGRSAMSKREHVVTDEPQYKGKGRSLQADIAARKNEARTTANALMDDAVTAEPEQVSWWRKLLSWLG